MTFYIKPVQYSLTLEWIKCEHCPRRMTYGIAAQGAENRLIIHDISTCRPQVEALILKLNRCEVSLCHFRDVIDDSLGL